MVFSLVVGINTRKDLSLIKIFLPKICITFGDLWFCIFVIVAILSEGKDGSNGKLLSGVGVNAPEINIREIIFRAVLVF